MCSEVYILSACRTAIGKYNGQFESFPATHLGSVAVTEALKRASLNPRDVDQVMMGQVLTSGQGQNPARQTSVRAQIPYSVPACTVNMLCGSGLKSVCLAYQAIRNEDDEIVVAGGQESMTRAHHSAYIRGISKVGAVHFHDTLLHDGMTDAFNDVHMGQTAEHLAKEHVISREAQDRFALQSQKKAEEAIKSGHFKKEIVPVPDPKSGKSIDRDEFPKFGTTLEALGKLRPAFSPQGSVTAGNASGLNDGAAAVVLSGERQVKARDLKPLAKIVAVAEVGLDPLDMGLGPIEAVKKVLVKAKWTKEEVDLYEINEAFAVQSIIVIKTLQVDEKKVNISGGAVALGHPIGASGARVLVTLIHNLERLGKKKGVAALCIGGGMGIAIAIEMC
ncbi:Thiolase N and/or ketoacyl-synt domain containing protein [Asbolus verrucosus]|uniref:Thiolase N and/or ketoacyl-synt domain containing protein n=1 Tax=Asbolus verrucosus TaxID=1661398 RepID=A0A482W2T1_ASBVE|nr:Thiolase N and/or ketoacyl-synt domain containing protein [Asbolus verrucosus]